MCVSDTDKVIGSYLKSEREKKNIMQDEIAEALNITRTSISKRESGQIPVSTQELINWCDILGISDADVLRRVKMDKSYKTNKNLRILNDAPIIVKKAIEVYKDTTNEDLLSLRDGIGLDIDISCFLWAFDLTASDLMHEEVFAHDIFGAINNIDRKAIIEKSNKDCGRKSIYEYATEDDFNFFLPRIRSFIDSLNKPRDYTMRTYEELNADFEKELII